MADDNSLNISDEDFLDLPEPEEVEAVDEPEVTPEPEGDVAPEPIVDEEPTEEEEETPEPAAVDEDAPVDPESEGDKDTPAEDEPEASEKPKEPEAAIDYKAEYERLMAPFKANGTQIKVKSTEDIVTLMQMGANYNKKMVGLKPSLKIMKMLEKNDLLDPDKISYLIDLNSKNPEAITQLLKDSGMDPMDVDVTNDTAYKPNQQHHVSDTELELDNVLESIQDTETYSQTLNVITKQWDDTSRSAIASNPNIIAIINGHMATGIYDKVASAVEYERRLGKLSGMSDLDAYKYVGDSLNAQGQLTEPASTTPAANTSAPKVSPQKAAAEAAARKAKKQAASPTKTAPGKPASKGAFNPLAASDEEFADLEKKNYQTF